MKTQVFMHFNGTFNVLDAIKKLIKRSKKNRHSLKIIFRHEFSEEQMYAYFTKDDTHLRQRFKMFFAFTFVSALLSVILLQYYLVFLCTTIILSVVTFVYWCRLHFSIQVPTDREYDSWVQKRASEALEKAMRKIDHDLSEDEFDDILRIHGFVLKGSANAQHYREQDLLWKRGNDGVQRYSVNVFRYFLPIANQLVVIIIDVNAVNHRDMREQIHEYFFADVVAVATIDERDTIIGIMGEHHAYLTQSFVLRISDGKPISVTISSIPLDHEEGLDAYLLPSNEFELVDDTIQQLRMHLRKHKQGPGNWDIQA